MNSLDYWLPFIGVAGGYIFGALLTWLLLRNRVNTTKARLEERLRASEKHIADLNAGAANLEQEMAQMRHSESAALKQQGSLEGLLTAERKSTQEKVKLLNKAEERMLGSFRLISQECLHEGQEHLAALIQSTFDEEQKEDRETLTPDFQPVLTSLERIETRLTAIETGRQDASLLLREQIARAVEAEDEKETLPTPAPEPVALPSRATTLPTAIPTPRVVATPFKAREVAPPAPAPEPTPAPAKSHDPRPYAAPAPTPTPSNTRRRPRSTPSTFLEELDAQPIPSSRSVAAPRQEEALPPVKLRPLSEPLPKPQNRDVLDTPLDDDFEGFEAVTLKEIPAVPDPKKAAADLRAALES